MKKLIPIVLILSLLLAVPLSLFACSKKAETYNPSKFKESIDLTQYDLVFEDEFKGDLNFDVWGDCRQGTRRDGFWTTNLAYTDGTDDGHLIVRTEMRGSRWCSDTHEREITGANGATVKVKYDDCNPFGVAAGDFGNVAIVDHAGNFKTGDVILATFDTLGELFDAFMAHFTLPTDGSAYFPALTDAAKTDYTAFYDEAMELFNYYSFVADVKAVTSTLSQSALVGVNRPYAMVFGTDANPQTTDLLSVTAHLFGFNSTSEFAGYAAAISDTYTAYAASLAGGANVDKALENGCFRTADGSFIFPIAAQSGSSFVLTYLIVSADGLVSLWLNDVDAALRATAFDEAYSTGGPVNNEFYCKNVLFVTGPEGVYSGAIRTMNKYTHGFGYYEIKCKLPDVNGIWHAFWLMCGNVYSIGNGSTDGIEIDVFEYLPGRDAVNHALHWDGYDEDHQNEHKRYEKTKLADGEWHTFGVNWDENGYAFYIDGKKTWSTTGAGICPLDGYMIISTEVDDDWAGWAGDFDPSDLPVDWVIDYVRVYEKK